jgi:predicted nucleic acid-binding protein
MKQRIYIETTIPSFYYEVRKDVESAAMRKWTKEWFDNHSKHYSLMTSVAVLDELEQGDFPNKEKSINMIKSMEFVEINDEIANIVETYIDKKLMPNSPLGDPLHLALASFNRCNFLLTWNCKHLANANKFDHIRYVNNSLGLFVPSLVTPLELLGAMT